MARESYWDYMGRKIREANERNKKPYQILPTDEVVEQSKVCIEDLEERVSKLEQLVISLKLDAPNEP
ncbi:MAG: hypothetical protein CMO97_02745 [Woeseia sp.]|nr:hypothetical protein [Woeseia sp.]|tara:strand:+ start:515 stop:715 length:201 start_codon:yes stop_codon:yes gene_type:complete